MDAAFGSRNQLPEELHMFSADIPTDVEAALGDSNPNLDGDATYNDDGSVATESEFA